MIGCSLAGLGFAILGTIGWFAWSTATIAFPDWLLLSARSPDGRHIAHAWCADGCDVEGKYDITISPVAKNLDIAPSDVNGFPPEGDLPEEDQALSVYSDMSGNESLRWVASNKLEFRANCLTDGNYRRLSVVQFRGVQIIPVQTGSPVQCPGLRG